MSSTILIVDDDPIQRRLLEAMVQPLGYRAVLAEGGEAALAQLARPERARIDLVVLDLVMPDLDGMGVLGRMRAAGDTRPVDRPDGAWLDRGGDFGDARRRDRLRRQAGRAPSAWQVSIKNALRAGALEDEIRRSSGTHRARSVSRPRHPQPGDGARHPARASGRASRTSRS